MIKLDSEVSVGASRRRPVRADHRRSDGGLAVLPEGVLTEDKVGQVERQPRGFFDPHLDETNNDSLRKKDFLKSLL